MRQKGVIKGINVSDRTFSRSDLDTLTALVQSFGPKGLAWFKVQARGFESPIAKFMTETEQKKLSEAFGAKEGDTLFLVADQWLPAGTALGALRTHFASSLGRVQSQELSFVWIVDFPLFQWNEEEKRLNAVHHPFTAPKQEDLTYLEAEPERVRARAYDIILNGTELGGGSIRIHEEGVQQKVFARLGIKPQEAEEKFGFLLKALRFGAPPHGGLAIGLDRLCALLSGVDSIREVIAFPKTQKGACPMTEAPSRVSAKQLRELGLSVKS